MQICFHSGHFRWFSHFSQFNEFICSAFKFYLDFIGFFFQSVCLKGFEGYWQGWWCGKCWPREDFAAVLTIGTIIPGPAPTNDTSTQLFSAKFPNTKLNKTYKSTLEQRPQYVWFDWSPRFGTGTIAFELISPLSPGWQPQPSPSWPKVFTSQDWIENNAASNLLALSLLSRRKNAFMLGVIFDHFLPITLYPMLDQQTIIKIYLQYPANQTSLHKYRFAKRKLWL